MFTVVGAFMIIGGIVALIREPAENPKKATSKGAAIVMIVFGALLLAFTFFILPQYFKF